jgi:hypothetical protein
MIGHVAIFLGWLAVLELIAVNAIALRHGWRWLDSHWVTRDQLVISRRLDWGR